MKSRRSGAKLITLACAAAFLAFPGVRHSADADALEAPKATLAGLPNVPTVAAVTTPTQGSPAVASNPDRDCFFGQTHVHTSWSLDAYIIGNTVTGPAEAYQFALGMPVKHPLGFDVKLSRPLDFQGVTDHSEYMGMVRLANDPNSPISKLPIAEKLRVKTQADVIPIFQWLVGTLAKGEPIKELLSPELAGSVWKQTVDIADQYYKPGTFTTFASYEWTSAPKNRNMHRNVFFRDTKKVPVLPFTAINSPFPEDLWDWMDGQRSAGNELLCISHNANLSDGVMFPLETDLRGRPIDAAWAQKRLSNEPLSEIHQAKGTSETHPLLSPSDEFANYELMNFLLGLDNSSARIHGSYIREAYQNGLALNESRGFNPYKFGVVGASDSHDTVVAYTQKGYFGSHTGMDGTAKARLSGAVESGMSILQLSTAGLAGVWAESNTRESIFDAMRRRETFGTSGVRIKVRLFAGWDFKRDLVDQKDWVKSGYARGVPMGADMRERSGSAPTFAVWAVKDPDDASLDRIQIVKGWSRNGQTFEKVYDVVWSGDRKPDPSTGKVPPVRTTVDIKNATYTNAEGAVELETVWTDPDFDPSQHAFYYARVLQVPTPRWSTYDARELGIDPPAGVTATVQERAWSSPIWYTPTEADASKAAKGTTVADLTRQGAVALDDAALTALVVGKTVSLVNRVTGDSLEIVFGTDGRRVINVVNGKPRIGDMLAMSELSAPVSYAIADGRITTTHPDAVYSVIVYRLGDKYWAARSNEFGFANYEVKEVRSP